MVTAVRHSRAKMIQLKPWLPAAGVEYVIVVSMATYTTLHCSLRRDGVTLCLMSPTHLRKERYGPLIVSTITRNVHTVSLKGIL